MDCARVSCGVEVNFHRVLDDYDVFCFAANWRDISLERTSCFSRLKIALVFSNLQQCKLTKNRFVARWRISDVILNYPESAIGLWWIVGIHIMSQYYSIIKYLDFLHSLQHTFPECAPNICQLFKRQTVCQTERWEIPRAHWSSSSLWCMWVHPWSTTRWLIRTVECFLCQWTFIAYFKSFISLYFTCFTYRHAFV